MSVREALCRGVPAIVSASAGVAEQYPSQLRGLLIANPDDPAELREKLLIWQRDIEGVRSAIGPLTDALRGRTWDAMSEQVAQCVVERW